MNFALQSAQFHFGRQRRSDSPYGAQILACASSLHVVHYNSALRSCRMKPPQRVHAVLWFRGTLRIPDERQSSVFQNLARRWKERDPTLVGILMVLAITAILTVVNSLR